MPRLPSLTVHFQGLCAFVRNRAVLADTSEVTVIMPAAEKLEIEPPLCEHFPVLLFREDQLVASSLPSFHLSSIVPTFSFMLDADGNRILEEPRPSLGIWPLARRELFIRQARSGRLKMDPSFEVALGLERWTGTSPVRPELLAPEPPELVAARMLLTDGTLGVSTVLGLEAEKQFVFVEEGAAVEGAEPVSFPQELRYDFFSETLDQPFEIVARRLDDPDAPEEALTFVTASVAISNLCPADGIAVTAERDFLAYYALLTDKSQSRPIPHLKSRGVRINLSGCPPGSMASEGDPGV